MRTNDRGERVPLTICDVNPGSGTITFVVQAVGATTIQINDKCVGDRFSDVLGPLGAPTEIKYLGTCAVVVGGVGAAVGLPVARALGMAGNVVIGIVGARDADHLILIKEMRAAGAEVIIATNDGSEGVHGFVTDALVPLIEASRIDYVFAAGPILMMQAVAESTREAKIPTIASLNPLMVDGTGMCGGCRVSVGTETKFACIDGPEFDAHRVDFAALSARNDAYLSFEACRLDEVRRVASA